MVSQMLTDPNLWALRQCWITQHSEQDEHQLFYCFLGLCFCSIMRRESVMFIPIVRCMGPGSREYKVWMRNRKHTWSKLHSSLFFPRLFAMEHLGNGSAEQRHPVPLLARHTNVSHMESWPQKDRAETLNFFPILFPSWSLERAFSLCL